MNAITKLTTLLKNTMQKTRKLVSKRFGRTRKLTPNTMMSQARRIENENMKVCHTKIHASLANANKVLSHYEDALKNCDSLIHSIANVNPRMTSEQEIKSIVNQYTLIRKYVISVVKTILRDVRYAEKDAKEFLRMTKEKTEHEIGLQAKTIVSLWLNNRLLMEWLSNLKSTSKSNNKTRTLLSTNKCKPHYLDHPDVNLGSKYSNLVAKLAELKFAVKKEGATFIGFFPKQLQSKHI
jgi:hypothetical protein